MSTTHYECERCGEQMCGFDLVDEACYYCGGKVRETFTTSGAWKDPEVDMRDWEERTGKTGKM